MVEFSNLKYNDKREQKDALLQSDVESDPLYFLPIKTHDIIHDYRYGSILRSLKKIMKNMPLSHLSSAPWLHRPPHSWHPWSSHGDTSTPSPDSRTRLTAPVSKSSRPAAAAGKGSSGRTLGQYRGCSGGSTPWGRGGASRGRAGGAGWRAGSLGGGGRGRRKIRRWGPVTGWGCSCCSRNWGESCGVTSEGRL